MMIEAFSINEKAFLLCIFASSEIIERVKGCELV